MQSTMPNCNKVQFKGAAPFGLILKPLHYRSNWTPVTKDLPLNPLLVCPNKDSRIWNELEKKLKYVKGDCRQKWILH